MEIDFLRHYGLDRRITDLLRENYGEDLLPVQESAIVEKNLFDGENMIISAPTSSGKTLVGEVAALHHIARDSRAIFLVPTKALAYEKYMHLKRVYAPLDIGIVISSRDHREHDKDISSGKYQIAVVVYEKLLGLLAQTSGMLEPVGLVVIDELQTLLDPERGGRVEELVTHLKRQDVLQLVALSAVLNGARLADWLDAKLVEEIFRPVELRQGVLCRGKFFYREHNSRQEGVEELLETDSVDEKELLLDAAAHLAERGEQTLIFVPRRDMTFNWAQSLYEKVDLPPAEESLTELESLEPNLAGQSLKRFFQKGIAVHSSDLTWVQRELVEKGLAKGEVLVAVTTSTLSEGMNMPVVNTLLCRQSYRSTVQSRLLGQPPQLARLSREEFQNMTGRSGRMGKTTLGRGMVAVGHEGEIRGVIARYLSGSWSHPDPVLMHSSLESTVLRLVSTRAAASEEGLKDFANDTLSAHEVGSEWAEQGISSALRTLTLSGLLTLDRGRLSCTATGALTAQYGLEVETGLWFLDWLSKEPEDGYGETHLLLIAALSADANRSYFPFFEREWKNHTHLNCLYQVLESEGGDAKALYEQIVGENDPPPFEVGRGIKRAMFLRHWCSDASTEDVEKSYAVLEGMAHRIGEECSWLFEAIADMARLTRCAPGTIDNAESLAMRCRLGLPREWQEFGRMNVQGLTRDMVKVLVREGITDEASLKEVSHEMLADLLPASVAERIRQ